MSPFYHFNSANYREQSARFPELDDATDRSSKYEGGQATIAWVKDRNNLRGGLLWFRAARRRRRFGLIFNDLSESEPRNPNVRHPERQSGGVYAEDQFRVTSWLTLNAGVRQTHFSGGVVENATEPAFRRFGARPQAELGVPRILRTLLPGAAAADTASGPLLDFVTSQNLGFIPLHGERDEERSSA